jgi:hypothetical protein
MEGGRRQTGNGKTEKALHPEDAGSHQERREKAKQEKKTRKWAKKHPRSRLAQAGSGERPVRKDQAGVTTEEKQA